MIFWLCIIRRSITWFFCSMMKVLHLSRLTTISNQTMVSNSLSIWCWLNGIVANLLAVKILNLSTIISTLLLKTMTTIIVIPDSNIMVSLVLHILYIDYCVRKLENQGSNTTSCLEFA